MGRDGSIKLNHRSWRNHNSFPRNATNEQEHTHNIFRSSGSLQYESLTAFGYDKNLDEGHFGHRKKKNETEILTGSMTPANGTALASLAFDATIFSSCFITGSIDVHSCFIVSDSNRWPASRIVAPALCGFGAGTVVAASSPLFASFLSPLLLASSFVSISMRLPLGAIDRSVVSSAGGGGFRVDDFGARLPPGFDMIRIFFSTFCTQNNEDIFVVFFWLRFHAFTFSLQSANQSFFIENRNHIDKSCMQSFSFRIVVATHSIIFQ